MALGEDGLQPAGQRPDPGLAHHRTQRRSRPGQRDAENHRRDRQQPQRDRHDRRRLVDLRLHGRIDAALPPERQPDQPEHVEGRQDRDEDADRPDPGEAELEGLAEDLVLAEEARQRRDAGDGDRTDQHRRVGLRDLLPEAAHLAHVLLLVDGVDHGS